MAVIPTLSQAVLLVAGAGALWLAVSTYRSYDQPTGRPFSLLVALVGVTAVCLGATQATGTLTKLVWLVTNVSIPVALLAFSFSYAGIGLFDSRIRTAAVLAPAVAGLAGGGLVVLGTEGTGTDVVGALASLPGGVFDVARTLDTVGFYYATGLVLFAVGLIALNVFQYEHLDTRLAAVTAFIGAWPWLGNFLVPEIAPAFGEVASLAVLAFGYATGTVVAGLAVGPLGLLSSSPAAGNVGPDRVLDSMDDAVIITDGTDRILRLNSACKRFETDEPAAVGRPLSDVLGRGSDELEGTVELETREGIRQFSVTRTPVTDENGYERGTTLVLRDVTREKTREQRLEVLNRVLRHNLRNNATTILGRAELISAGQQPEASAEKIIETTQNLVGLAESARDIESMISATAVDERVSIPDVLDAVVADVETEFPEVEVTTAVPASATAAVSSRALETVLTELLENAAKHNDAAEPIVVVSVDETDADSLTVAVSDNGPGLPEQERAVLTAGEEDQLQHGSGLGLWAVYWGVTQMGGQFSLSENDPRGTTVTLTLPTDSAEASRAASAEQELSSTG